MEPEDKKRFEYLAKKWLDGTLSPDEVMEYNAWYDLAVEEKLIIDSEQGWSEEQLKVRMFQEIKEKLELPSEPAESGNTQPKHFHLPGVSKKILKIVAIIVFTLVFYKGFRESRLAVNQPDQRIVFENTKTTSDVLPGSDKAILKLADGRTLMVDSLSNGLLAIQGNMNIIKTDEGGLLYSSFTENRATDPDSDSELLYNTLITPKGAKFQITLSDGSSIWLNAASSLRFPASFSTDQRAVSLDGEAYFEVAKEAGKPFLVHVKEMEVKVKGTHFNINAYEDDGSIHTTLLEGAVDVRMANGTAKSQELQPGNEATVDQSGQIQIGPANLDQAVAWKNDLFQFDRTDLKTLLKEISRWYNIDVELKGPGSKDLFTGTIPRTIKLSTLLSVLDYSNIRFKLNGRKLVVYTTGEGIRSA